MKNTTKYSRGNSYRKTFFDNKKGIFGSDIYICTYCGRPIHKNDITVDHLIPCHRVKKKGMGRLLMKIYGVDNINDIKNLVPACKHCNSSKGAKMGFWLIRGMLGRHTLFWLIFWVFVFFIMGLMLRQCWPLISDIMADLTVLFT